MNVPGEIPGVGGARYSHTAAMYLDALGALEASVDGRAGRAGDTQQPAPRADLLDQVDDAQRPGLLAQGVDGLFDRLFLLRGQASCQRLPASRAAGERCDLIGFAQPGAKPVDRSPVEPEPLGQSLGLKSRHRQVDH